MANNDIFKITYFGPGRHGNHSNPIDLKPGTKILFRFFHIKFFQHAPI